MAWKEAVITNDGLSLLTECVLGGKIEITSAAGGENVSPAVSLMAIKEIAEPKRLLHIAKTERIENGVTVNVRVQNKGVSEEYCIKQIGLFARLEGSGAVPVLLAVIQDENGEIVPKEEDNPEYLLEYDFVIPVNNLENITVSVTPNTFATVEDLSEMNGHIENKSNPHEVTKAQVGLGNVPNVSTNGQTPTYTVPAAAAELASGEKFGTAMGKIAKAVKELIIHLADSVKHVTAAERTAWNGKAAGSHSHGAASQSANGFMTAADKAKLDGITAGANKYAHPVTSGNKHIPAGGSSGQILRWTSDGTAVWGADNNTTYSNMGGASASAAGRAGLVPAPAAGAQGRYLRGDGTWQTPPDTNTTYSAATQSVNGLMTASDKKKLDGIAAGANAYAHPSYTARTGVPAANQTPAFGGTFSISQPVSDGSGHITVMNTRTVKIPDTNASASAAGLMSAADKNKMNEIKISGINVTYGKETIPRTTSGPVSKTVTISHKTDIVFLWVLNHAAYRTLIVLNSYAGSENLAGSFTVNLSQSASSAKLNFSGGTSLETTVYYAAFRLS